MIAAIPTFITPPWSMTKGEAKATGWTRLAAEFAPTNPNDSELAAKIVTHIQNTGGRVAYVSCEDHWELWRPRSEMETKEETERRLAIWTQHKLNA